MGYYFEGFVMLQVQNIEKKYGSITAVSSLSFSIKAGEFVGLVGPNGAGKTTTIKMLAGQLIPTSGSIIINGLNVVDDPNECRKSIGYVPEFPDLYDYLTCREMLEFVISVRGEGDLKWALDVTGLGQDAERPIREYSQGMRRKTALACAMVSRPKLLILDESLNGLDPPSIRRVKDVLENLRQSGTAILLSTHVLDTLERIASRILLIEDGLLKSDSPISELDSIRSRF
jgi:ABC-2 type transport system ATP-binding protein